MIHLETDRWYMRDLSPSDLEGMFLLDSDPEVHKYLGNEPVTDKKKLEKIIQSIIDQYHKYGMGRWAVIEKGTDEFMGWCGLKYETTVRDFPYNDIGYRFRKKFWGQGIGYETAVASLKYGFEKLDLDLIQGAAHVDNLASNRILEKIGLQYVEKFEFDGDMHNWYSLKKIDWEG